MEAILALTAVLALTGCDKMWNEQSITVDGSSNASVTQSQTGMGNKQTMRIGNRDDGAGSITQEQRGVSNKLSLDVKGSVKVIQKQSGVNREQSLSVDGKKNSVHIQIDE